MQLRDYQKKAVKAITDELGKVRSTLLVLPTGCGKTIVFSEVARQELLRGGRVLILAHRGELLVQAQEKLAAACGVIADIEKGDKKVKLFDEDGLPTTIVIGSVQSLSREERLSRFPRDMFSLVIIDECHHSLCDTYTRILKHFAIAKIVGVTATADRGDGRGLSEVFDSIAYEYSIVDAVRAGYLSKIKVETIPLKLSLETCEVARGDFVPGSINEMLLRFVPEIANALAKRCMERKTVIFTPLIATSMAFLPYLQKVGFDVREIDGSSENRKEILDWFAAPGKGKVLLNSMLLTEGWDCPSVDCVVVLRPTQVRALYVQMVGRGTRLSEGKENLLVLDFLWLSTAHRLCRPACLLGEGEEVEDAITERAEKEAVDLFDEEVVIAGKESAQDKREKALARKLKEQSKKVGKFLDPLMYFEVEKKVSGKAVTMRQIEVLEEYGVQCPEDYEQAEAIISVLNLRKEKALATPKQVKLLSARGFQNVQNWTSEQARKMIARMTMNRWQIPTGVNPYTYVPRS